MTSEVPNPDKDLPENVIPIIPYVEFYESLEKGDAPNRARFVLRKMLPELGLYCPLGEEGRQMVDGLVLWLEEHPDEPKGYVSQETNSAGRKGLDSAQRWRDMERFEMKKTNPLNGEQST